MALDKVARMNQCWPSGLSLSPMRIPDNVRQFQNKNVKDTMFIREKKCADILQVVAKISCFLKANIMSVYAIQSNQYEFEPVYVHVIITPDIRACSNMALRSGPEWKHLRCIDENCIWKCRNNELGGGRTLESRKRSLQEGCTMVFPAISQN